MDTDIRSRRTGIVSIAAVVLIAAVGYELWTKRGTFIHYALWIVIPLVLLAVFVESTREPLERLFGGIFRLLGSGVSGAAGLAGSAVNASSRQRSYDVELHRFRLVGPSGSADECLVKGYLIGGDLRMGDDIAVTGYRNWKGVVVARRIHVHGTGSTVTGKVPFGAHLVLVRQLLVAAAAVAAAVYVLVTR